MSIRKKYPRTLHVPWSLGKTSDDKTLRNTDQFQGVSVVVTEKLDGENTTIYPDGYLHARSLSGIPHGSQNRVRALAAEKGWQVPSNWRICGENVYAKHSIEYTNLTSVFYVFSIWETSEETDRCLSWEETVKYCEELGLHTVPVLYQGIWNEKDIRKSWNGRSVFGDTSEGYVIRPKESFFYEEFSQKTGKFVRANHVQTDAKHWRHAKIELNHIPKN